MASHIRLALRSSDRAAMRGSLRRTRPDRCGGAAVRFNSSSSSRADTDAGSSYASGQSRVNYFTLLKVPQTFHVDEVRLKANYRGLMHRHHPDKRRSDGGGADGDEESETHASLVTLAYDTLRRPHLRAQHLLALETGLAMEDDHQERERRRRHREEQQDDETPASAPRRVEELVGAETLMEVLELREAIDAETSEAGLRQLLEENRQRMEATGRELEDAFGHKDFDKALRLTARLQYWNRIHETIRDKLPH